jgi:hypothetical protein
MESSAPALTQSLDYAEATGLTFAAELLCFEFDGREAFLDCLRLVDAKVVVDLAYAQMDNILINWNPVIDNVVLADNPINLMRQGKLSNPVPVMSGKQTCCSHAGRRKSQRGRSVHLPDFRELVLGSGV